MLCVSLGVFRNKIKKFRYNLEYESPIQVIDGGSDFKGEITKYK